MMLNKHKLTAAARRRENAEANARKANWNFIELQVQQYLQNDQELKKLEQEIIKLRRDIHLARLNITKKTTGIENRLAAIRRMQHALETHKINESYAVKRLGEVTQQLEVIKREAQRKVLKELKMEHLAEMTDPTTVSA